MIHVNLGQPASREADERLLAWLKRRAEGEVCRTIAADYNAPLNSVMNQTKKVLDADLKESGEPAGAVREAYW